MTPDLHRLEAAFRTCSPLFRDVVERLRKEFGREWEAGADEMIRRLFPDDDELLAAVRGYSAFAMKVLRLQAEFERTGRYREKRYEEVQREVYGNSDLMRRQYLPGLLLSHELWPHHVRQRMFFEATFLAEMRRLGAHRFYDIGIGTGFYSRVALTCLPDTDGVGFDISEESKRFSEWHALAFGLAGRLRVELRDIADDPPDPGPWLLCVEVIEHLEDPPAFLACLRGILSSGGKGFITTALNAPHDDHIFLYRTAAEVCQQILGAGFAIDCYFCSPAGRPSRPGLPVPEVAAFIVS